MLAVPTLSETLALVGRLTEPERAIFVGGTLAACLRSQRESLLPLLLLSLLLLCVSLRVLREPKTAVEPSPDTE